MPKQTQKTIALTDQTYQKLSKIKDELQAEKEYSNYSFDQCITDLITFYKNNMGDGSFSMSEGD